MMVRSVSKKRLTYRLAIIPGLGHLAMGSWTKGIHLFAFATGVVLLMIWRTDRIALALSSRAIDEWVAVLFLIGSLLAAAAYSRWDVWRLFARDNARLTGNGPWQIAWRRFRFNKLAVGSIYIILILYILAILAPLVAPQNPSMMDDILATRYLPPSFDHLFGTDEFGRDLLSQLRDQLVALFFRYWLAQPLGWVPAIG